MKYSLFRWKLFVYGDNIKIIMCTYKWIASMRIVHQPKISFAKTPVLFSICIWFVFRFVKYQIIRLLNGSPIWHIWSTKSCNEIPDIAYSHLHEAVRSDRVSLGILSAYLSLTLILFEHRTFICRVHKVENNKHNERTKTKLVLGVMIFSCESCHWPQKKSFTSHMKILIAYAFFSYKRIAQNLTDAFFL